MKLACTLLVAALVVAGCTKGPGREDPVPAPDQLTGVVLQDGVPLADLSLTLRHATGTATTTTDDDGAFVFDAVGRGPCTLHFALANGNRSVQTDCPGRLTLRLPAPLLVAPPTVADLDPGAPKIKLAADAVTLQAQLTDLAGKPLVGVRWTATRDEETLAQGVTGPDGSLTLQATPGPVHLELSGACLQPVRESLDLETDLFTVMPLPLSLPPPAGTPTLAATAGPAEGVTLTWSAIDAARGYEVEDSKGVRRVGGLAWGDHTPSGPYRVRAVDACGQETAWSAPADAEGLAPAGHPSLVATSSASAEVSETSFPVLGLDGQPIGSMPWRVVKGTGNCCENFVATTPQGWILDFGGSSLLLSKDEGLTWTSLTNHQVQICGEGAVMPAAAGDILGMNWEFCLGAGTDGVWSMKYIADDDRWVEGSQVVHAPFFDRPWISTASGPFPDALGRTGPMIAYIFTNIHDGLHGTGHGVSIDGVTYTPDTGALSLAGGDPFPLPDRLRYDPDADWSQPQREAYGRALDPGLHVLQLGLTSCMLVDHASGRTCASQSLPVQSMQRDAAGRLHDIVFDDDARTITYRWSDDVGRKWDERDFPYLPQMAADTGREWDVKASAALGKTMVALHTLDQEGTAIDLVYVFRDNQGRPEIDQVLQVGAGGGSAASGVAADERFDFMSSGFLPDGRMALSFRDGTVTAPALAVSLRA